MEECCARPCYDSPRGQPSTLTREGEQEGGRQGEPCCCRSQDPLAQHHPRSEGSFRKWARGGTRKLQLPICLSWTLGDWGSCFAQFPLVLSLPQAPEGRTCRLQTPRGSHTHAWAGRPCLGRAATSMYALSLG